MMKKRSGYFIAIGFLLLICLGVYEAFSLVPDMDTFTDCVQSEQSGWYAVSETGDGQRIYRIDDDGKVRGMSDTVTEESPVSLGMSSAGENLLWLSEYKENGNKYYRLRIYDKDLELTKKFEKQKLDGEVAEPVFSDGKTATVTALSADRKTVGVYELDLSKQSAAFKESEKISAMENRFFIRAVKEGDTLYVRYDNGLTVSVKGTEQKEEAAFPYPEEQEVLDGNIKISGAGAVLKYEGLKIFTGALVKELVIAALLLLLYGAVGRTSYRLQRFAVQELVLLCVTAAFCGITVHALNRQDREDLKVQAENRLERIREEMESCAAIDGTVEGYADTEAYRSAFSAMLETKASQDQGETLVSLGLVQKENGEYRTVLADGVQAGSLYYNTEENREALQASGKSNKAEVILAETGTGYQIYGAAPGGTGIAQSSYWAARISADIPESSAHAVRMILTAGVALFAAGTLLMILILWWEGRQVKQLVAAFQDSAKGKYQKKSRPLHLNSEMEMLWNGMEDYAKSVERLQYRQISQQKMYARFIPEAVSALFEQWTPEKLSAGDFVSGNGIIGCISVQGTEGRAGEEQAAVKNRISDLFLRNQETAVFIPESGNLEEMWGVFLHDVEDAVHTGIRLLSGADSDRNGCSIMMLLHKSGYTYGITGNENRILPYFSVDAGKELLYYAKRLRELGVKLAVTEQMMGAFENTLSMRCIGYIRISGADRNLYEVLEAYPAAKRQGIEGQSGKFARALELYYGSDFYLARNVFVEILRECPEDEVAKWYLFACENRLGSVKAAGAGYGLFVED